MARSANKLRQDIYLTEVTETRSGIDRVKNYSTPVKYRLSVSATAGVPAIFNTGILPDYDREITVIRGQFTDFAPSNGTLLFVDVTPDLDDDGNIRLDVNGDPFVRPDYVVVRKMGSERSQIYRYGIKRVDYGND